MTMIFKWIVVGILLLFGIKGDARLTASTIDIHLHDTYFVVGWSSLIQLLAL